MWRERLVRILIVGACALLVLGIARSFANQNQKQPQPMTLPNLSIKEKIQNLGEGVLGTAIKVLPGELKLNETSREEDKKDNQAEKESEPIKQPVENVQKQTEALIETIKQLPKDQIEAIKKQIYKEFCEKLIEE